MQAGLYGATSQVCVIKLILDRLSCVLYVQANAQH